MEEHNEMSTYSLQRHMHICTLIPQHIYAYHRKMHTKKGNVKACYLFLFMCNSSTLADVEYI